MIYQRTNHVVEALRAVHVCKFCVLAGEKLGAAHSVVAKLTALAMASAAALTGTKEKRSYALVNDTWSLLIATLVGIGNSTSCPAGLGKLTCLGVCSRRDLIGQHAFGSASSQTLDIA